MKCPHCSLDIHFEEQEPAIIQPYDKPEKSGLGVELVHGFCSACDEIIVIIREGKYNPSSYGGRLSEPFKEDIVYPKIILPKALSLDKLCLP